MGLAPLFAAFRGKLVSDYSAEELVRLDDAWALAVSAHSGQVRSSGEPYVTHPLAVASILEEMLSPGVGALCAALLHDVVEDSDVPLSQIASQFGADVAHIVDGVSKLDAISASSPGHAKDETLRKLVEAGGQDWRVFAVKLCDRLHNMRTLGAVSAAKRRRVALETRQVLFPLARYMGFHAVARELEALCFKALYPWRWRIMSSWADYRAAIDLRRASRLLDAGIDGAELAKSSALAAVRDQRAVDAFHLLGRQRSVRAVFGVPSLTMCCDSMAGAYERMCLIHRHFVFVPASFNCDASDGVVSSKVLLSSYGPVVEVTARFPRIARKQWYRQGADSSNISDFTALATSSVRAGQFTQVLRELVADKSIVVFSPKGLRVSLPHRSTGFDFAFAIHSELGLHTSAVVINGVHKDASVELESGDIVEVLSASDVTARAEWEPFLRSPRARTKLRHWLKEVARNDAVELGRRLLAEAISRTSTTESVESLLGPEVLSLHGVNTIDALLQRIGQGLASAQAVATGTCHPELARIVGQSANLDGVRSVVLDGLESAGIKYCGVCRPLPGDLIVCSLSATGALVHQVNCAERDLRREYGEEFVPQWATVLSNPLPCLVRVEAEDRRGLLADCATAISGCNVNVVAVSSKSFVQLGKSLANLEFSVLISRREDVTACVSALSRVNGVYTAQRI